MLLQHLKLFPEGNYQELYSNIGNFDLGIKMCRHPERKLTINPLTMPKGLNILEKCTKSDHREPCPATLDESFIYVALPVTRHLSLQ